MVLIRVRPARRSWPAQIQRRRAFLDRIPGPRWLVLPDGPPAARRPPRAQAAFRTSSNSAVQWQVFPLGLPTFRPFLLPGDLAGSATLVPISRFPICRYTQDGPLLIRQPVVVPVARMPLYTPSCPLKPPLSFGGRRLCLSTEISSSWPRKSDCGSPGTMNLSTVGGRTRARRTGCCVARTGTRSTNFRGLPEAASRRSTKRSAATGSRCSEQADQLSYAFDLRGCPWPCFATVHFRQMSRTLPHQTERTTGGDGEFVNFF